MGRKTVSGTVLTLLLICMLVLTFEIQQVRASETIYIRADGSVDPDTAPISSVDNITYTLTDNIYDNVVIERDNIVVDGAGYKLEGAGSGTGIDLSGRRSATIKDAEITLFEIGIYLQESSTCIISKINIALTKEYGIRLESSSDNIVFGNNISSNMVYGIFLYDSSNNNLSENTVADNDDHGIVLSYSSNNSLSGNTVTNNDGYGIFLYDSSNNNLSWNNITKNLRCIRLSHSSNNALSGNTVTNNGYYGVQLSYSSNNDLSWNNITNNWHGIYLGDSSNNNLSWNNITKNGYYGIFLYDSSNNNLSENTVTNNDDHGIVLSYSSNNSLSGNTVANNDDFGIFLSDSSNDNTLSGNAIAYNAIGIFEGTSSNSLVYHNNFLNNEAQTVPFQGLNFWDNGPLELGNYWSDYQGIDQNGDGVGDTSTPHHRDRYPIVVPVGSIPVFWKEVRYDCSFLGNATLSMLDFDYDSKSIGFDVSLTNTTGYCNITLPRRLLKGAFNVLLDNAPIDYTLTWNETHTSIYFEVPVPQFSEYTIYNVRVTADVVTPLTGDINNDCLVDIFDVVLMTVAFGSEPGDPNWSEKADLNNDDSVDIYDVVAVTLNFGKIA